jgi:hypothetical protein
MQPYRPTPNYPEEPERIERGWLEMLWPGAFGGLLALIGVGSSNWILFGLGMALGALHIVIWARDSGYVAGQRAQHEAWSRAVSPPPTLDVEPWEQGRAWTTRHGAPAVGRRAAERRRR